MPPVPTATTPIPPAKPPLAPVKPPVPRVKDAVAPVAEPEAVANVEQVLGGTVIDEEKPKAVMTTHVVTPEVVEDVAEARVIEVFTPAVITIPDTGVVTVACGQPRYSGGTVPPELKACGQELVLDIQSERVTACVSPAGQNPEFIEIGGLHARAFLCNPCFSAHRNAVKAAKAVKV